MSKVNAPQPDAVGAAEVFDSTIQPSTPTISSVGQPGPTPEEAIEHSGAMNMIDPYLQIQYIATATVKWTVGQSPGTLLYSQPIHPARSHQWLAHLQKMYNVWSGGISFSVKVAGTGFHAGAVMLVRLPPNIPPESLASVQDWTAFEYLVIDPKTLQVESSDVMDQRNIMYHYQPLDVTNPQSFGGFFCIVVLIPLNTSSSGATEISLQTFQKPSQTFAFNQLKPIDISAITEAEPDDIVQAFSQAYHKSPLLWPGTDAAADLRIASTSDIKTLGAPAWHWGLDGVYWGWATQLTGVSGFQGIVPYQFSATITQIDKDTAGDPKAIRLRNTTWKQKITSGTTGSINILNFKGVLAYNFGCVFNYIDIYTIEVVPVDPAYLTRAGWAVGNAVRFNITEYGTHTMCCKQAEFAPTTDESFLTLATNNVAKGFLPFQVNLILSYGKYKNFLKNNECMVFELIDDAVGLPILPFKLHYQGFTTCPPRTTGLNIPVSISTPYSVRYLGVIPSYVPFGPTLQAFRAPSIVEYERNLRSSTFASTLMLSSLAETITNNMDGEGYALP